MGLWFRVHTIEAGLNAIDSSQTTLKERNLLKLPCLFQGDMDIESSKQAILS